MSDGEKPMEIITLTTMARRLKVPARWLKEQAEAGRVPALRAGRRRWLCEPEAVTEALAHLAAKGGDDGEPPPDPADGGQP